VLSPIGQVFLRLIFMVVVPLVFSALVLGVYELGRAHGLGGILVRTLGYTVLASSISVALGIGLVNLLRPGEGFRVEGRPGASTLPAVEPGRVKGVGETLVGLVPTNPVRTASEALTGEMLPFMVMALLFGLGLSRVDNSAGGKGTLISFFEQVLAVSMKIVDFALWMAPVAVFAIMFGAVMRSGASFLVSLVYYMGVVVGGLLIQQLVVYSLMLKGLAGRSPWEFFRKCREVYVYAFSTSSSNATLPVALRAAEETLGLPRTIARFVLTVGATANQNGTALFEGVTVLFLAQVYGVELTLGQQVLVAGMAILAGVGTAGVPSGSIPLIMILLGQVGVPPEAIGLVLGADRFLDMCRTVLNVSGDLVLAAVVSGRQRGAPGGG
jgi:DAACS family dicarboxylate/amino acid:cation (Na+ or H+) symporter